MSMMNNKQAKCRGFELDKSAGSYEDRPCCQICKFNEPIGDKCLIGMDEGGEDE